MAEELGIEWHILVDGDDAGHGYMKSAKQFTTPDEVNKRITLLKDRDIEHCFWNFGYADFYLKHAKIKRVKDQNIKPNWVIKRAVKHYSKPYLSLSIAEAIMQLDSPGIPDNLQSLIQKCVALARSQSSNEK